MKNTKPNSFAILFLSSIAMSLNAQIEVATNGNVGIAGSPSNYELKVYGDIIADHINTPTTYSGALTFSSFQSSSSGIKTDNYGYSVNLVPYSNNTGYLGYDTRAFKFIYGYHISEISDERQKENISNLNGSLNIITKLRGVKYDLKPEVVASPEMRALIKDENFINHEIEREKNQIGFIAQEVYEVLPNVVNYNDSADVYSIEYSRIIPVLVEAIKEQNVTIEELNDDLLSLQKQIIQLQKEVGPSRSLFNSKRNRTK